MQLPTIDLTALNQQYDPTALVVLFIVALVMLGTPIVWLIAQLLRSQSKDRAAQAHTTDSIVTLLGSTAATFAQNTAAITQLTSKLGTFLERNAAGIDAIHQGISEIKDDSAALKQAFARLETAQGATRLRIDEIAEGATSALDALKGELVEVRGLVFAQDERFSQNHAALVSVIDNIYALAQAIRNDLDTVIAALKGDTEEITANA